MNVTGVAFKANDTEAVAAYLRQREAEEETFVAKAAAYEEEIGIGLLTGIQGYDGAFIPTGFEIASRDKELPAGWRNAGSNTAVPAKRTAEGKTADQQLRSHRLAPVAYPGVPEALRTEIDPDTGRRMVLYPQVEELGGAIFLTFSREPKAGELEKVDPAIWSRAKLSEYFAAREDAGLEAA